MIRQWDYRTWQFIYFMFYDNGKQPLKNKCLNCPYKRFFFILYFLLIRFRSVNVMWDFGRQQDKSKAYQLPPIFLGLNFSYPFIKCL